MKLIKKLLLSIITTTTLVCSGTCIYSMEQPESWRIQTRQGDNVSFKFLSYDEFTENLADIAYVLSDAFSEVFPAIGIDSFLKQQFLNGPAKQFELSIEFLEWFEKTKIEQIHWESGIEILQAKCTNGDDFVPKKILGQIDQKKAVRFLDAWIKYFQENTEGQAKNKLLAQERVGLTKHSRQRHFDDRFNTSQGLEQRFKKQTFFACIAFIDNKPVGAALFNTDEYDGLDTDRKIFLDLLAVSPSAQGRGLSRQLVFGVTRLFQNLKCITLDTNKINDENACRVYDHFGFRPYEETRYGYYDSSVTQFFKWINWKNVIPAQIGAPQHTIENKQKTSRKKSTKSIRVQNNEEKSFEIIPVNSVEDLDAIPQEVHFDYRVTKKDTEKSRSCLKGIALDFDHVRSQIFAIKDGSSTIGLATLIVTPFKYLHQKGLLRVDDNKVYLSSLREMLDINDEDTFVIDLGWFNLLAQYRNKKLGQAVLHKVLVPTIEHLAKTVYNDKKVLLFCSPRGCLNGKTWKSIHEIWQTNLAGERIEIEVSGATNFHNMLGEVYPDSKFTEVMAERFNFERLPGYSFTLGPVFIKKLF